MHKTCLIHANTWVRSYIYENLADFIFLFLIIQVGSYEYLEHGFPQDSAITARDPCHGFPQDLALIMSQQNLCKDFVGIRVTWLSARSLAGSCDMI